MSDDPYTVLGVSRGASQEEVRRAYRKLAKELHPDLHPGDKTAEDRFKAVTAAYDLLGDPDKRARYDRGEIDATGAERPQHRFYREYADTEGARRYASTSGFEDFFDESGIFADLFGRAARGGKVRMRGADLHYRLTVDFLDAANGASRRVDLPDGTRLDIAIPAGVRDGQVLRLRGKGRPGLEGGPPGDALVEISVAPHPLFRREGDDVAIELPVGLDEAVLGAKIRVPTVTGPVTMTLPKGANSGQVLRLRGKGILAGRSGRRGDQLVRIRVALPERIDPELEAFVKSWREKHRYDPRSKLGAAA